MRPLADFLEREGGHVAALIVMLTVLLVWCHPDELLKELIAGFAGALTFSMKGRGSVQPPPSSPPTPTPPLDTPPTSV